MNASTPGLELWGGVECTINRVGDRYFDQCARSRHRERLDDFDRFAELGLRALRFPILWEHVAAATPDEFDWRWTDAALERCRSLGIRVVAGLVHHGSGPRYTDLLDPEFAPKLARYARAVAERYPWIDAYTPINEPLTTARFSGLYGHWFPHRADSDAFSRALLNQCRATVLAMREIRAVNPDAILIQTDDLGRMYGSPHLQYQVDFENARRWITWDLLCGNVDHDHTMWSYLRSCGRSDSNILALRDDPCVPDIIGINYYITSERYLDAEVWRYREEIHGGNGRDSYVDVSAVGILDGGIAGPEEIYREAWRRFRRPIAITEAHLGCSVEQQMRWMAEIWRAAENLRGQGADVRAVCAWALLGAHDWDNLVTRDDGHYEPGAFDIGSGLAEPTRLAEMIRALGQRGELARELTQEPGWWRLPSRLLHREHEQLKAA